MSTRPCAYCGQRPRHPDHAPFCSPGCRNRDLNQWLSEGYAIPANSHDDELSDTPPLDKREGEG